MEGLITVVVKGTIGRRADGYLSTPLKFVFALVKDVNGVANTFALVCKGLYTF